MVERTLCMREARGSMPLSSKIFLFSNGTYLVHSWRLRTWSYYMTFFYFPPYIGGGKRFVIAGSSILL